MNGSSIFQRYPWLLNAFGLFLTSSISLVLLGLTRAGAPSRLAFGLLILGLLCVPIVLHWQWGFVLLYAFVPFLSWIRRVYSLYQPETGGNDLIILIPDILILMMLIGFIAHARLRKPPPQIPGESALLAGILFLAGLTLVGVFNPLMGNVSCGVNGVRAFTIWFFTYLFIQNVLTDVPKILRWLNVVILTGTLTGLYGAYQYIYGFPHYDQLWAENNGVTFQAIGRNMRAFSTFSFTSTFSHYMVIAFVVIVASVGLRQQNMLMRLMSPFFMGSCLLGLAFTFVRSSYLGLCIAVVVGLVAHSRPQTRALRLIALIGLAITLMVAAPKNVEETAPMDARDSAQLVADRMLTIAAPSTMGSAQVRLVIWERIFINSFSFPVGVGMGAGNLSRFGGDPFIAACAYTESQYFTVLAELGWPGILIFLWICIYGFIYSLRIYDRLVDPQLKRLALMAIMLQGGILTIGMSGGSVLYTFPCSAFYWSALGLIGGLYRIEMQSAQVGRVA